MDNIKRNIDVLKDNKVPVVFAAKPRNMVIEGTKNCLEVFVRNTQEFEQAFSDDIRDMCDPARPGDEVEEIKTMKAPLSLSNYHEIKVFIRYLILKDHRDRIGSKETKIKYGDPSWKPSFWPDEMFCWVTNKKNFSDVKNNDFPGNHSTLDVLREAIKRCLEAAGLDPEQHYDKDSFTNEVRKKRTRNRGLHNEGIVEELENDDPRDQNTDEPNENEPIPFIPRRPNLYDNDEDGLDREEDEISHNETARLNNTVDDGDELGVDNYIAEQRAAAAVREREEEETLRRSRRNIPIVNYSLSNSTKSDLSSESDSSFAPSNKSLHQSTESDISSIRSHRIAKRKNVFENSIESDISSLRRSHRIRKKKQIFDNSENVCKKAKRRKRVDESLDKLIAPPSPTTQRKEDEEIQRQKSFEKRMSDLDRALEEEMAWVEKSMQDHRDQIKQNKEFSKKIKEKADNLRKNLSEETIKDIFKINLKYFKNLQKGLENSWRHDLFYQAENKAQNERLLLHNSIAAPFSDSQQEAIWNEVRKIWLQDQKMHMKNNKYVELVLLPEIFITIYQKFFCLGTKEIAEQYIKDPGSMDPRDMSSDPDSLL